MPVNGRTGGQHRLVLLTRGNVSNCLRFLIKQNNCILIEEVMSNKHIVNRIKLPSFLPGPKI